MFTSGFFNSLNSDRKYNAEQMSAIFDGVIKDGIFDSVGNHFAVTPGSGLTVSVGTGRAWLNSTWSYNDTAYPIALSAASPSLNRIDLICIKVDKSTNVRGNSIVCIEGTPASSPVEPATTDDTTNGIYYHKLAAVTVRAGATSISSADITNYVGLSAGTPYVTGILSSTAVDELWSQWDGEFNDWWDDIKATLDDNVVTTILNKIDHITPKEATMNLYGFSHIDPPPSGKTYQAYSTDAILNQISSLLNNKQAKGNYITNIAYVATEKTGEQKISSEGQTGTLTLSTTWNSAGTFITSIGLAGISLGSDGMIIGIGIMGCGSVKSNHGFPSGSQMSINSISMYSTSADAKFYYKYYTTPGSNVKFSTAFRTIAFYTT